MCDGLPLICEKDVMKPVPYSRFSLSNIRNALNYLTKAHHIGKIVISFPEVTIERKLSLKQDKLFNKNATYLITGGLGGIGFVVAKWMVDAGAGCLVLIGRSPPGADILSKLKKMRGKGCRVLTFQVDVGNSNECENLFQKISSNSLKLPPLRGVIHSAGVLSDATFANQTWEKHKIVFNAKVNGCLNLHNLTKDQNLEHFVLFSSVSANFAPIGQSNHTAANYFLDSFAHYRRSIGLPAQSVNWGAWSEVGAAADWSDDHKISSRNVIYSFNLKQGIAALEYLMTRPNLVQIAVAQFNLKNIHLFENTLGNFLHESFTEVGNVEVGSHALESETLWDVIKSLTLIDREVHIKKLVVNLIKETLKIGKGEVVDEEQTFSDMGLDSLMSVELKNKLQLLLGDTVVLSGATLADHSTISRLSAHLAQKTLAKAQTEMENRGNLIREEALNELIRKDSILPDDIKGCGIIPKSSQIRNIFLTGATGLLGGHLLEQLLKISHINVFCLVRSPTKNEGLQKLLDSFSKYKLSVDSMRTSVIIGDVAKQQFGIASQEYDQLSKDIDVIYHVAAVLNFVEEYMTHSKIGSDIRSVNVLGTVNVLRFAGNFKTKRVFYASSIGTINKLNREGFGYEDFPDSENNAEGISLGYALTKFVSEKLIAHAISRGIPCVVIRYPNIAGNSQTGHFTIGSDIGLNLLLWAVDLGVVFENEIGWSILTADVAAELTLRFLFSDDIDSEIYNLIQPNTVNAEQLAKMISELGYNVKIVSPDEFFEKLHREGDGKVFATFKDTYGPHFFTEIMHKNYFVAKHVLSGTLTDNKFSEKVLTVVPDIMERVGSSYDGYKSLLLYAQCSGLLGELGIYLSKHVNYVENNKKK